MPRQNIRLNVLLSGLVLYHPWTEILHQQSPVKNSLRLNVAKGEVFVIRSNGDVSSPQETTVVVEHFDDGQQLLLDGCILLLRFR